MEQVYSQKAQEKTPRLKIVSFWLFFCCFMVFTIIVVGAITRLTESGLSITEWKPLIGAIPPLNDGEWQKVFDLYKQSPEFQKKNFWMELEDFKKIYFWEWAHRLLGRLIGLIYALPFLFFLTKGWIPDGYKLKLCGVFLLGGLQGFMGWYMVKSGLVDIPAVSHYRLAAHLSLALLIYGLMLWFALEFWKTAKGRLSSPDTKLHKFGWLCLTLLSLTILWGAFTAGLDAGLVYNETFPKMGETWIPSEIWHHKPIWVTFFENHAGVQFVHRWLALTTALFMIIFSVIAFRHGRKEFCIIAITLCVLLQVALGMWTLFSGVDITIAALHQANAVILLGFVVATLHATKPVCPRID